MSVCTNSDLLAAAHAGVRQAVEKWDATDLSKIYQSIDLMETAASTLQEWAASMVGGRASRAQLVTIQSDLARLTRLTDAALGFQRGLLLRLGSVAPGYGASGTVLEAPPRMSGEAVEA